MPRRRVTRAAVPPLTLAQVGTRGALTLLCGWGRPTSGYGTWHTWPAFLAAYEAVRLELFDRHPNVVPFAEHVRERAAAGARDLDALFAEVRAT